jgi:uncharacterized membrane protein YccF (DUF307 family)
VHHADRHPLGVQHFKMAGLALLPFGKEVNLDL